MIKNINIKKNILHSQVAKIILLFVIFVLTTFILGGFILNGLLRIPSQFANLIVIAAILLITWKAYKKEGKNLSELGLNSNSRHIGFGLLGVLIGGLFILPLTFTIALIKGYPIVFNPSFSLSYILNGLWIVFPTVILEELVFRGICFKKTVEISGVTKGNIIFASLFILSHWINLGAFGNPALMTILLITGLGHVLFGTAFLKSKTLFFPIGLHLGNNWVNLFVFSNLNINDPSTSQIKPSLMHVITTENMPAFNGQLILTTSVTAVLFILLTLAIGKWTKYSPFVHDRVVV